MKEEILKDINESIDGVERAMGENQYDNGYLDALYMVRVKVVKDPREFAFGEKGFVQKSGRIIKMSRDKEGRVWRGWKRGTKF